MLFNTFPAAHVFHISASRHLPIKSDNTALLKPFPSDHEFVQHRCDNEPEVSRICVSDSIIGCLTAVPWFDKCGEIRIFRSVNKLKAYKPYDVIDADITGERWLHKPAVFKMIYKTQPGTYLRFLESIMPRSTIYDLIDWLGVDDDYTRNQQEIFYRTLLRHQSELFETFEKVS